MYDHRDVDAATLAYLFLGWAAICALVPLGSADAYTVADVYRQAGVSGLLYSVILLDLPLMAASLVVAWFTAGRRSGYLWFLGVVWGGALAASVVWTFVGATLIRDPAVLPPVVTVIESLSGGLALHTTLYDGQAATWHLNYLPYGLVSSVIFGIVFAARRLQSRRDETRPDAGT